MQLPLVQVDRSYKVTTKDNGNFLFLGNAAEGQVGAMCVQWVPDEQFTGALGVTSRIYGFPITDSGVPLGLVPVPYRRVNINGTASDYGFDTATLTGPSIINVPANGLAVALLVSCTAGTGWLYSWPLLGPCSP